MERAEITLHGHRFSYRSAGSGPLLVLLHGIAGSSATWEDVIPWLSQRHTVIAPDLLGHGDSSKPRGTTRSAPTPTPCATCSARSARRAERSSGTRSAAGVAMQFAYQFPERCERLVLVSSGGLGRELHPLLRAAALPGAEVVLPWLCVAGRRSVGTVAHALGRLGLRASADLEEVWRSFVSLEHPDARQAFLHTVRGIIDLGGQRVSATDRLYLAGELPTLIVWGEHDPLIPVRHAHAAHAEHPGQSTRDLPRRRALPLPP